MAGTTQAVPGYVFPVEGEQTIAAVEEELARLHERQPASLLLPVHPKKWWFGGEAALIQLLITWGRRCPDATLVTHIGAAETPETQLTGLVKRPFGFVGVWMARDVTDRPGVRALKTVANAASEETIDLMWHGRRGRQASAQPSLWGEPAGESPELAVVGNRVFLASVDHHPRWRIPQCYFPTGELRRRDDFVALATAMAARATDGWGGSPITPGVRDPLGGVLHELFKNTHEWARTDEFGVPLPRSVRGILAQAHSWPADQVASVVGDSPALATYLAHPALRSPDGRWRFLELSVFDSGPGLARRWLSGRGGAWADAEALSLEQEHQACLECFLRWRSSSGAGHKGLGLHEVMQTLSHLGGFFRVRTGRLSLYRDFVSRPHSDAPTDGGRSLSDWTSGTDALTPLAPVEGVLYTMLIPIRSRSG